MGAWPLASIWIWQALAASECTWYDLLPQEHEGSCKLCYAARSDADVAAVRARAKEANLICMGVAHAGPPEAKFMVAVGPVPSHLVSDLVKGLEALP